MKRIASKGRRKPGTPSSPGKEIWRIDVDELDDGTYRVTETWDEEYSTSLTFGLDIWKWIVQQLTKL